MLYTQLSNVTQFDYSDDRFGSNPYDTPSFLSSDVSENNFNIWEGDTNFPYTAMLYTNDEESWESQDTSFCSSTAVNKPLSIGSYESSLSHWQQKTVDQWTPNDTENWVMSVAQENHLECEGIHRFQDVDGLKLLTMTETRFNYLEPICGNALYQDMQKLKSEQGLHHLDPYDIPGEDLMLQYPMERQEYKNTIEHPICTQDVVEEHSPIQPKIKRSPGRPRIPGRRNKKQEKKTGRLWEFIRDLLLKPEYCPSLICWEDHDQGIFRFVHSEKVARLWGTIKENPKMTYEKLSRAMRYYYRSKVLQPVLGRRLVYKFGPTATGWQTPDPNFKNRNSQKCKL